MATRLNPVDIVIVGMGWTGGIAARVLGPTGLKIAVLERGGSWNLDGVALVTAIWFVVGIIVCLLVIALAVLGFILVG